MKNLKDAKYQLKAVLLCNNISCKTKDNWSAAHLRWLTELVLPRPTHQIVLTEAVHTIIERTRRTQILVNELGHQVEN